MSCHNSQPRHLSQAACWFNCWDETRGVRNPVPAYIVLKESAPVTPRQAVQIFTLNNLSCVCAMFCAQHLCPKIFTLTQYSRCPEDSLNLDLSLLPPGDCLHTRVLGWSGLPRHRKGLLQGARGREGCQWKLASNAGESSAHFDSWPQTGFHCFSTRLISTERKQHLSSLQVSKFACS